MSGTLHRLIEKSIVSPPCLELENEIVKEIRGLPQNVAFDLLKEMIDRKSSIALAVANRISMNKTSVKEILLYGLLRSDASTITFFLKYGINKIGVKGVIEVVKEASNEKKSIKDYALYWLPIVVSKEDKDFNCINDFIRNK